MVVERFPPDIGGSGVRYSEIAKRLGKNNEIDIFTLGSVSTCDSLEGPNVYRSNLAITSMAHSLRLDRVAALSRSTFFGLLFHSYDIIDVDFWPMFPFFSAKTAKPSTPTVVSWNVAWPFSYRKLTSEMSNVLAHVICRLSTQNVTVSKTAKKNLVKHLGLTEDKVEIIPNGVDDTFFKARLEARWGRMVFVGRLEPQKRLDLLIAAFKIVRKSHSDVELHIIGAGPLHQEILEASKKVEGLYLHNPIPREHVKELVSELCRSWLFVSASEFETFGLSIAEALQIGLPAVLTQTPNNAAIGEIAIPGYNSIVVQHDNPKLIAEAMERLYENEELWKKLSYNAKHSTSILSWDEVATKTEAMYKRITKS
jgi:glycosyltransferase involved in cell wall biosynthesis